MNTLPAAKLQGEELSLNCTDLNQLYFVPVVELPEVGKRQQGFMTLTNFRLCFHRQQIVNSDLSKCDPIVNIPLGFIRDFKVVTSANNAKCEITFITRLIADLTFDARLLPKAKRDTFIRTFVDLAFPLDREGATLFPFLHKRNEPDPGWCYYERLGGEYERILTAAQKSASNFWRREENPDYQMVDSYPKFFYVPSKVKAADLNSVAEFRTKRRLPVLSWCHPTKGSVIARSSQPRTGVGHWNSSTADQNYIEALRDSSLAEQLTIADARPKKNAIANMARGGGTEAGMIGKTPTMYTAEGRYTNVKFFEIDNIHVVRGSYEKLKNLLSSPPATEFHEKLEKTGWLSYIQRILFAGASVAEKIEAESQSVLVHCSDGWDRTAQVVSLAMLMLDPYYRTMQGFATLIEKEWTAFGHKFSERNGTGRQSSEKEESPIFLQFVECVWQMLRQFSNAFEFSELFLIRLLDGFYSNQYGTFLFSSDKERVDMHKVPERTKSIWTDLVFLAGDERKALMNPFFNRNFNKSKGALLPSVATRAMKLWRSYYFRHHPMLAPRHDLKAKNIELLNLLDNLRVTEISLKQNMLLAQPQKSESAKRLTGVPNSVVVTSAPSSTEVPTPEDNDSVTQPQRTNAATVPESVPARTGGGSSLPLSLSVAVNKNSLNDLI